MIGRFDLGIALESPLGVPERGKAPDKSGSRKPTRNRQTGWFPSRFSTGHENALVLNGSVLVRWKGAAGSAVAHNPSTHRLLTPKDSAHARTMAAKNKNKSKAKAPVRAIPSRARPRRANARFIFCELLGWFWILGAASVDARDATRPPSRVSSSRAPRRSRSRTLIARSDHRYRAPPRARARRPRAPVADAAATSHFSNSLPAGQDQQQEGHQGDAPQGVLRVDRGRDRRAHRGCEEARHRCVRPSADIPSTPRPSPRLDTSSNRERPIQTHETSAGPGFRPDPLRSPRRPSLPTPPRAISDPIFCSPSSVPSNAKAPGRPSSPTRSSRLR